MGTKQYDQVAGDYASLIQNDPAKQYSQFPFIIKSLKTGFIAFS